MRACPTAKKLDGNEWIPIRRVAEIAGGSLRSWERRAGDEQARAASASRDPLAVKAPPPEGNGKPIWWFSRAFDDRLTRYLPRNDRDARDHPRLFARYPHHAVDRAYRKLDWLRQWERLCLTSGTSRQHGETIVARAKRVHGDAFSISVRALQQWQQDYQRIGREGRVVGVEGLIDRRCAPGGVASQEGDVRDQAAIDYFYALYHTESRLSAKCCHDVTVREARKNRWTWPVSYSATTRWLRDHDDLSLTCLLREGPDRWAHRFMPHIESDYESLRPGELYVCDHHQCDFWIIHQDKHIRPWLTAIQDVSSRMIVGWHLGPTPHQDAIVASMRRAFRDKAIPDKMRIDNGKDFTSQLLTGITKAQRNQLIRQCGREWKKFVQHNAPDDSPIDARWLGITGELGIELIYAIPYAPWSKGTIERFFGRFEEQHGKTYTTYCGNSPEHRPSCLNDILRGYDTGKQSRLKKKHGKEWKTYATLQLMTKSDILTMEQTRERIAEWLDCYHHTAHRGAGMHGATPLAMWKTATSLRKAGEQELLAVLETRGLYKVGANGVRLKIGSATIGYGKSNPALQRFAGRDVLIRLDPEDISQCWAFTPDRDKRTLITTLLANERIAPNATSEDAREAIKEQMHERGIMHKAQQSSARRTRKATARINEHAMARTAELRKTGTCDVGSPNIKPVQTGFDGVSKPVQTTSTTDKKDGLAMLEALVDHSKKEPSFHFDSSRIFETLFSDDPCKPEEPDREKWFDDIEDIFMPDDPKDQTPDDDWTDEV